jgi:hypothetical protein
LGIDTIAENWAKENGISVETYIPDLKKYGRGAAILRNNQMVLTADQVIAFWDGKSKGRKHTIHKAAQSGNYSKRL